MNRAPLPSNPALMIFTESEVPDLPCALWQAIMHYLCGHDLAAIRAVCRLFRRAVDDAVNAITLSNEAMQCGMPRHEHFPACKQYTFIDTSENVPLYVRQRCATSSVRTRVFIYGEACWMASYLQGWKQLYRENLSWVGLVLRLCEDHQDMDLSSYLQRILFVGSGLEVSFLGLWCEVRPSPLEISITRAVKYLTLMCSVPNIRTEKAAC